LENLIYFLFFNLIGVYEESRPNIYSVYLVGKVYTVTYWWDNFPFRLRTTWTSRACWILHARLWQTWSRVRLQRKFARPSTLRMTSPLRKKRKFVGKINGHLSDFVEVIKSEWKICLVDLCYACLFSKIFLVDLPICYILVCFLFQTIYVDYVHESELSSLMNVKSAWIVSNSYNEGMRLFWHEGYWVQ